MSVYTLIMCDDSGSEEVVLESSSDSPGDIGYEIMSACTDWVRDGEWGDDGARVCVHWDLIDEDGTEIDSGSFDVDVPPNHDALIRAAGGDPGCDHEWSSECEGGCTENPGVWSTGGTSMVFKSHCTKCELRRTEHHTGSQRNPGEHDWVEYEMPSEVE